MAKAASEELLVLLLLLVVIVVRTALLVYSSSVHEVSLAAVAVAEPVMFNVVSGAWEVKVVGSKADALESLSVLLSRPSVMRESTALR